MLADQHILDGLAFARSMVNRTLDEEWQVSSAATIDVTQADWTRLQLSDTHDHSQAVSRRAGRAHVASGRSAFVASILALTVLLNVGDWTHPIDAPVEHSIAAWQAR